MERMLRKQIYIPNRQQSLLKRRAKARGVSEAAPIRQAIEASLRGQPGRPLHADPDAWVRAVGLIKSLQAMGPLTNERRTYAETPTRSAP
jgi:hypothetical protein